MENGAHHGEDARAGVPELEVLIRELLAVDGLAAGAVAAGEVARLAHEVRDDAVEDAVLVAEGLARPADPLLAGAQRAEVLARLRGDVDAELERDATDGRAADAHVEETTREGRHGVCVLYGCATEFVTKVPLRAWTTSTISYEYLARGRHTREARRIAPSKHDRDDANDGHRRPRDDDDDDARSPRREVHGGDRGTEDGHKRDASCTQIDGITRREEDFGDFG